jgi:hypothetical protein
MTTLAHQHSHANTCRSSVHHRARQKVLGRGWHSAATAHWGGLRVRRYGPVRAAKRAAALDSASTQWHRTTVGARWPCVTVCFAESSHFATLNPIFTSHLPRFKVTSRPPFCLCRYPLPVHPSTFHPPCTQARVTSHPVHPSTCHPLCTQARVTPCAPKHVSRHTPCTQARATHTPCTLARATHSLCTLALGCLSISRRTLEHHRALRVQARTSVLTAPLAVVLVGSLFAGACLCSGNEMSNLGHFVVWSGWALVLLVAATFYFRNPISGRERPCFGRKDQLGFHQLHIQETLPE